MFLLNIPGMYVPGAEEVSLFIGLLLSSFFYKKYNDYKVELKYQDMIDQLCKD